MTAAEILSLVGLLSDTIRTVLRGDVKATLAAMDRTYDALTAIQRAELKRKTKR